MTSKLSPVILFSNVSQRGDSMGNDSSIQRTPATLEDNLKKALTELLILHLLSRREHYIGELTETLRQESDGNLTIVFPYAVIYRMIRAGYIIETSKHNAPDGRRRQYYGITETGRGYLAELLKVYDRIHRSVNMIVEGKKNESEL